MADYMFDPATGGQETDEERKRRLASASSNTVTDPITGVAGNIGEVPQEPTFKDTSYLNRVGAEARAGLNSNPWPETDFSRPTSPSPQRRSINRTANTVGPHTRYPLEEASPSLLPGWRSGQDVQVIKGMENIPLDKNLQDMRSPAELSQARIANAEYRQDILRATPSPLPQTYQDWGIISDKEKALRTGQYNAEQQNNTNLVNEITRATLGLSGGLSRDASDLEKQGMADRAALQRTRLLESGATGREGIRQRGENDRLDKQIENNMKGAGKYDHADQKEIDKLIDVYYAQDTDPALRPQLEKRISDLRRNKTGAMSRPTDAQLEAELKKQGYKPTPENIKSYRKMRYGE